MISTNIPTRFHIPFANAAGSGFIRPIPEASQIGIQDGAASLETGFPPLCFQPVASGGVPPFGEDFNGLLKQITQWAQWQATGAAMLFDGAFATAIGGYPKGAELASSVTVGTFWRSTVDNNTTDPDGGSAAGWVQSGGGVFADEGYRINRDGSIEQWGGASSDITGKTEIDLATATNHIAFPHACLRVITSNSANGPPTSFCGAEIVNNHVIRIWQSSASGVAAVAAASWRAIGY